MDIEGISADDLIAAVKEYNGRRKAYLIYEQYYKGNQELKYATEAFRNEYGRQFEGLRENLLPGLITAFTDNLGIASWGSVANDKLESDLGLKGLLGMVNNESFRTGDGYILAWPNAKGTNVPHYQRSFRMVPKVNQDDPSQLEWIARFWYLGKYCRVNVYYADRVERWVTASEFADLNEQGNPRISADWPETEQSWVPFQGNGTAGDGGPIVAHNFGKVPAIWTRQDAIDPYDHGISVLEDAIPLQDMLNRSLADTMVLSGTYAKPFWYLLNYQPEANQNPLIAAQQLADAIAGAQQALAGVPNNLPGGGVLEAAQTFKRSEQSIFAHDGPGPFGQLQPPDIGKMLDQQDRIALKMARVVGLPSYYITQTSGDVPSGASLRVLKQRMTSRIGRFQRDSEPALKGLGELLGMREVDIEWTNPQQLDPLEQIEVAVAKKRDLGYALEDAIADLDEQDVAGILQRAQEKAAKAAQAFQDGALGMDPVPGTTLPTTR